MDIRWKQRFSNYLKAIEKMEESVSYINSNYKNFGLKTEFEEADQIVFELIQEGLIQRFGYTHELAWNVMKDYAEYQGNSSLGGSRDSTREAFKLQLISDGDTWMDMIASRNKTSHTYNEEIADEIYRKIISEYFPLFESFRSIMQNKLKEN